MLLMSKVISVCQIYLHVTIFSKDDIFCSCVSKASWPMSFRCCWAWSEAIRPWKNQKSTNNNWTNRRYIALVVWLKENKIHLYGIVNEYMRTLVYYMLIFIELVRHNVRVIIFLVLFGKWKICWQCGTMWDNVCSLTGGRTRAPQRYQMCVIYVSRD